MADDAGLGGETVADLGDVANVDRSAINDTDRKIAEALDRVGAAVEENAVLAVADFGGPGWESEVLRVDGVADVGGGEAFGEEGGGVEIDLDLADLAAERQRNGGALDGGELETDGVEADVVEGLFGEGFAAEAELEDGDVGSTVADDEGRRGARRHDAHDRLADGGDLGDGRVDAGAGLEENFDDPDAGQRLRLDVFDVVNGGGDGAFAEGYDTLLHLFWREAGVRPQYADDRDVDGRKNVLRHAPSREEAENNDQQGHHGKRVGPTKGETYNPHSLKKVRQRLVRSPTNIRIRWSMRRS